MKNWIIIRTYHDRFWAEEDSLKLHDIGVESKMEEIAEDEWTPEIEEVGPVRLLVSGLDLEKADRFLLEEEEKVKTVLNEDSLGGKKMLLGGITCMLGLLAALSPNGAIEGVAWITVGLGAFQFMRGLHQQREEEKEILDGHHEEDEEDGDEMIGF